MSDLARCEYCHRPIRWARTRKGKKMPLDPDPSPTGNVVIEFDPAVRDQVARVLSRGEVASSPAYLSHFATCPNARRYTPENVRRAIDRRLQEHELDPADRVRPCSVQGCVELIARNLLLCRPHWRLVPPNIQQAILKHSARGQVWDDPRPGEMSPPLACRSAAFAALEAIAARSKGVA